jgi:hypothetical protein
MNVLFLKLDPSLKVLSRVCRDVNNNEANAFDPSITTTTIQGRSSNPPQPGCEPPSVV